MKESSATLLEYKLLARRRQVPPHGFLTLILNVESACRFSFASSFFLLLLLAFISVLKAVTSSKLLLRAAPPPLALLLQNLVESTATQLSRESQFHILIALENWPLSRSSAASVAWLPQRSAQFTYSSWHVRAMKKFSHFIKY